MKHLDRALLAALRAAPVHLPGGELATTLGVPREAIAARVAALCAAGFEIEDRPGLGFRLLRSPDRLIADDLHARLGPPGLIREILVFSETDSTNQRALDLGAAGAQGGAAIFAERQTAGRGRFSRHWESAAQRGLWFSLLLRPVLPLAQWPRLTLWAAVALAEAVEQASGLPVRIKWPNDLQVRGRKLAGILIELGQDHAGQPFAVAGFGVNVNHTADDFSTALRKTATSLHLESHRVLDRPALAAAVLASLGTWWARLDGDFAALLASARHRSSLLGQRVTIQTAGEAVQGLAEDLDDEGRLVLRRDDGRREIIGAGEATVAKT